MKTTKYETNVDSTEESKQGRGGKSGKKPRKSFKPKDKSDFYPRTNDASWYFKYPEIANTSAKFAFNHRNGMKVTFEATYATNQSFTRTKQIDPVCAYAWILTPGVSESGDDAINITSKSAWKMLNRRFRGNRVYQQSDFGIIQFGIVDFMASLAEAERLYGLMQYYALNNKQVPDKLLISLGYLPGAFTDLADFRLALNKLVVKARTLCLVRGYSLLDHALLLTSNIFKDKDTARGQLFAFRKMGYWIYDPTNPNGSALNLVDYTYSYFYNISGTIHALRGPEDIIKDLTSQLNALLDDDDVDQICSDILAFYGNKEDPAELVTISNLPEDYTVRAIYSDMINRQIHNAVLAGLALDTTSAIADGLTSIVPTTFGSTNVCIYQEKNVIKFNLSLVSSKTQVSTPATGYQVAMGPLPTTLLKKYMVDTDILDPKPEDIMEMTRFSIARSSIYEVISGANTYRTEVTAMPSTLILSARYCRIFDASYSLNTSTGEVTFNVIPEITTKSGNNHSASNYELMLYDWAPIMYDIQTTPGQVNVWGDLDNFIMLGEAELRPMHEAALLSEFKNPLIDMILKEN